MGLSTVTVQPGVVLVGLQDINMAQVGGTAFFVFFSMVNASSAIAIHIFFP